MADKQAMYWKNGEQIDLPNISTDHAVLINSIFVYNDDVYTAGILVKAKWDDGEILSVERSAVYWKNNELFQLITVECENLYEGPGVSSIHVVNNNVYVFGSVDGYFSVYWKNGKQKTLPRLVPYGGSRPCEIYIVKRSIMTLFGR